MPVAQRDASGETRWTFTDHLGTPLLQMSAQQGVVWRAEHEPYDQVYALRAQDLHQPLRLPGQEAEQLNAGANGATGRSYNVHRWYAADIGRYSRPDPIGLAGGINLYGYVEQNPVVKMDPLGLSTLGIGGRVINRTDCCVLVSENGPTKGQQQFYVKPHSTSGSHDVDAIYFNDGSALKIPDFSIYVIYDCGDLNATPTGFFSRPLLSYLHIPKYRTKSLPNRRAQEQEFGIPILPPPPTCGCP